MTITREQLEEKKKLRKVCTTLKKFAIAFSVGAVVLLFIAFFSPPPYEIHSSVIAAVGEIFGFAALLFAWEATDRGIDAKITHGGTSVELNNPDNPQ